MAGPCFICDERLKGRYTRMSTSITPHSKIPYSEKICELLGEEFVIIVNTTDLLCVRCTSLMIHIDKLENEVKLVKNTMMALIQNKYGTSPSDQAIKSIENAKILNENLIADKQPNPDQLKLQSGLPVRKLPKLNFTPARTPIQISKIQPQLKQKPQKVKNQQTFQKQQHDGTNRMKTLESSTHVQLQKPPNLNQKDHENSIRTQTAAAYMLTPVPQNKKSKFRCQVCSYCYDSRLICLDHINKEHKPTTLISDREKEIKYSCPVTANILKLHQTSQKNNQKVESPIEINDNQQNNKIGTVDINMLLNYNISATESANTKQEKETDNSLKVKTVKESKSIEKLYLVNKEEEKKKEDDKE